jgi:Calcium/calmodulin dependent protein kinase II Association.
MPNDDSAATRTAEFFRLLDAKDEAGLRAQWVDDPQAIDEITRGWLRGRIALEDYFQANLPHLSDIHSTIDALDVRTWGDVEVQTYVLRQTYVFDGTRTQIVAPTTMIWHRVGGSWKVAVFHSIPLSATS